MRKIVFALSVVLTVMTACEDNNDSTINGNRSAVPFSQIQLSEKSAYEAGVPTVTTTQTYSYSQGQLTGFTIVQSYSVQGEPMCIENAASVTYSEHQAVVTDNFGNVSVIPWTTKDTPPHVHDRKTVRSAPILSRISPLRKVNIT